MRSEYIDALIKEVGEIFKEGVELLSPGRELPEKGYNKKKGQYTAEIFIEEARP